MYKKSLLLILSIVFYVNIFAQYKPMSEDSLKVYKQEQLDVKFEMMEKSRQLFIENLEKIDSDSAFTFNIRGLAFREFPDIRRFTSIINIDAGDNQLSKVKFKRKNIKNLERLDLRGNGIKKIRVGTAPKLKSINLNNCDISKIPISLILSKKVSAISLSLCPIERLPWWLKYKKSINNLSFSGGELIIDSKNFIRMRNLNKLQIVAHSLASLPDELCEMKKLESLVIARTGLNKVPNNFDSLKNLRAIIFYQCNFSEIPMSCFNLPKLKHLDFYFNNISFIPVEIVNCDSLQELYLSFNKISVLPDAISQMQKLHSIYIHHNNIEDVPEWINTMDSLRILDMGFNDISNLPNIDNLDKLMSIDFQSNNISEFPVEWLLMPDLYRIFLFDNPFKFTKKEFLVFKQYKNEFNKKGGQLFINSI